jgi:hypothetical protein
MTIEASPVVAVFFMLDLLIAQKAYAALEWQARSMGWQSRGLVVACPLEELVRQSRQKHKPKNTYLYTNTWHTGVSKSIRTEHTC